MSGPDEPRGWAPLEPPPEDGPPPVPPAAASGAWAPPQGPPGWAPPPPQPHSPTAYGGGYGPPPQPKGGDARTGPLPLHPMSVGDVLDGAFKLLKANARTLLLVVAAFVVPLQLVSAFVVRDQVSTGFLDLLSDPTIAESQADFALGDLAGSLFTVALGLVTTPLIAGAVSRVCAASYLGRPIGAAEALSGTLRRLPALLAAAFLVLVAQGLGFVLCILPGIALTVLYAAVTPALMIEDLGPLEAMRRSWRLLKPRFWPVLGIVALAWLIASFLGNLLGGIPSAVGALLGGSLAWLWIGVGAVLASIVSAPITAIVDTLLYFDGRIRHEGFDLQVMAQDLDRGATQARAAG
ncbi:MAG TPA: hypothetical protein VM933_08485 [Acidimicrobiales bacterium]|nr:hypothetical protein [Acidimicrobiales bacterium]